MALQYLPDVPEMQKVVQLIYLYQKPVRYLSAKYGRKVGKADLMVRFVLLPGGGSCKVNISIVSEVETTRALSARLSSGATEMVFRMVRKYCLARRCLRHSVEYKITAR